MAGPARDAVRRRPKCKDNSGSGGLFSSVFSFVSREIESFVVSATGGQVNVASSSTDKSEKPSSRKRQHERRAREIQLNEGEARLNSNRHRQRRRSSKTNTAQPSSRSKSADAARKHHYKHILPAYVDDADEELSASDHPQSQPSPPQHEQPKPHSDQTTASAPLPTLRKKPSITMPGSLFSRTSSLEPEDLASQLGGTSSAVDPPGGGKTLPTEGSLDAYVSPWRTRPVTSVQDAVQRFNVTSGDEADFSLRIPSPQPSPVNFRAGPHPSDETLPPPPSGSPGLLVSSKGKGRMQDDDLMFIVGETSDKLQVEAKERELAAAREEQRQRENQSCEASSSSALDERERDKQRIKMLEEEVKRLREELSRSQGRSSTSGPPPPPPPPPLPAPLPIRIDTRLSNPDALFASARAALRHTSHPVEAPINHSVSGRKRQGKPTVNVPSEQMAAFLNEIKTVRLRKVGTTPASITGIATTSTRQVPESSTLSKSTSALSWASGPIRPTTQELTRRRSLASLRDAAPNLLAKEILLKAGQKRKADAMECDELNVSRATKRRLAQSSDVTVPSGGWTQLSASSSKLHQPDFGKQTWPSFSANEIDLTTPSLCSDNERDGDGSLEDQTPSTPPGLQPAVIEQRSGLREPDIIDVDLEEDVNRDANSRAISPSPRSSRLRKADIFEKRPPMSPIPDSTPRKPAAPARVRRVSTPKPKHIPPASDSDSDTNTRNIDSVPCISLIPASREKPTSPRKRSSVYRNQLTTGRSKGDRRPPTLDEELRTAQPQAADAGGAESFEDNVFVATGTKNNRKGFLAHGGGGGPPVFMGVGYVQGAEESDTEVRRKRVLHTAPKSTSQRSLIPRLGGRS
ncbi:hypothetical protein EDD17DRAFT_80378 [Pisolithus thermaeus]|nr:hypothetical protein EDD17DRAFT_80378 [Pisolithus thermaeus]